MSAHLAESSPSASAFERNEDADLWIEVLAPVEVAAPIIAGVLGDATGFPPGVALGRSAHGSILLNQRAWVLLHPTLKEIDGLRMRHSTQAPIE